MPVLPEVAYQIKLPEMLNVRQIFPDERIEDISAATEKEILREDICSRIKKDQTIAVLVGSRGISNLKEIVKTTVDCLHRMGARPFIVPAMGSHGGATAEGQIEILEGYGITEDNIGAPIRATMETAILGFTDSGIPVHIDKNVLEADAIIPIARIKPHTDFEGPIQSGMCKMLSIGIGKHNGCSRLHQEGVSNFSSILPAVAAIIIEKKNVPFSIAIIENAHDHTNMIKAVSGDRIIAEEPSLLMKAESLMPRLQFDEIDVLIVEKIGKDISGNGMDPNITGKLGTGPIPDFNGPKIKRIIVLGLTNGAHNNASGIGAADFITREAFEQIDFTSTYANAIASVDPESVKIPVIMDDEEQALRAAIQNCTKTDHNNARVVRIKHTLDLIHIQVSSNLAEYCRESSKFEIS